MHPFIRHKNDYNNEKIPDPQLAQYAPGFGFFTFSRPAFCSFPDFGNTVPDSTMQQHYGALNNRPRVVHLDCSGNGWAIFGTYYSYRRQWR